MLEIAPVSGHGVVRQSSLGRDVGEELVDQLAIGAVAVRIGIETARSEETRRAGVNSRPWASATRARRRTDPV